MRRLVLGELDTNCWVVGDDAGGPAIVIDPAGGPSDAQGIVAAAEARRVELVVLTHAHFDHLGSARALLDAANAHLAIHEIDAPRIVSAAPDGTGGAIFGFADTAPRADRLLREGERIQAGALTLEVWLTPGHTAGSISLVASQDSRRGDRLGGLDAPAPCEAGAPEPLRLFSGDTLFAGGVGRSDFPGGDARALQRSLARIATLPDDTVVHPGHGPDTTVGRERRVNPFFPRA